MDKFENLNKKFEIYRAIFEATPDGIIVLNEKNQVVESNQAACNLFGYKEDEIKNKNIIDLIKNITKQELFFNKENNILLEASAKRKDLSEIPIELAIAHCQISFEINTICVVRNIFERKQSERYLSMQHDVMRVLTEFTSIHDAIPGILEIICKSLKFEAGFLWEFDSNQDAIYCTNNWCVSENKVLEFTSIIRDFILKPGVGLVGRVWENKKSSFIHDITIDPGFPRASIALNADLHGAFAFPIFFEGKVIAVLEFFMRRSFHLDDHLIEMLNDLSNQVGSFIERERIQNKLLETQRISGMVEIATSVLHNIGNILNSVNVSTALLTEKLNKSELSGLFKIKDLLNDEHQEIFQILQQNKQGRNLRDYLIDLAECWLEDREVISKEIASLNNDIQHINSVIKSQQFFSTSLGVKEFTYIDDILNEALSINSFALKSAGVIVQRDYENIEPFLIDKVKLLQILVNLIRNSYDAMQNNSNEKKMTLRAYSETDKIYIQVTDNGEGIAPENKMKIFSYGFTTKKEGHGFGLHACAIAADEMGGKLIAESEGKGLGATFTLELPHHVVDDELFHKT